MSSLLRRERRPLFLETGLGYDTGRSISEETSRSIDQEVKKIIEQAQGIADRILKEHLSQLATLAQRLLEKEVIEGEELREILAAGLNRLSKNKIREVIAMGKNLLSENDHEPMITQYKKSTFYSLWTRYKFIPLYWKILPILFLLAVIFFLDQGWIPSPVPPEILHRLYYLPIVLSGLLFGFKGGVSGRRRGHRFICSSLGGLVRRFRPSQRTFG